jgi:hypothetical protein
MHMQGIFGYTRLSIFVAIAVMFLCSIFVSRQVEAATITSYSDRISDSAPSAVANHTINFNTTVLIPAGGFIQFTPEENEFEIPLSPDFDIDNIALYVATSSGYHLRQATTTASLDEDGVSITTGTSGQIEITLNDTVSIPANASIRLLIGSHTPNATSTDLGITNPSATGTYSYAIRAGTSGSSSQVRGRYAIVDKVEIEDIDTRETDPPIRFNGAPSGTISGTTVSVEFSLETDEFSKCRYSTASNTPYFSMTNEFTTTFVTVHSDITAVATSTSYVFYVRCIDDEGNENTDDYEIAFDVPAYPDGIPGESGDNENEGSGTGSGSGTASPGSGDPSGNDNSSGGSSSGGGGGGGGGGSGASSGGNDGSGGFEGSDKPYQSGDGQVIIKGYAFPRSTITILVDGQIADTSTSLGDGSFEVTLNEIARGAYTFGVYGTDKAGVRSSTYSTTFTVTGARGSTLSNVNVMPSIKVTPNPVDPNSVLKVSGYSIPDATVTIENQSEKSSAGMKTFTATSDGNGAWSIDISTDGFNKGTYKVRAKAKQEAGVTTNFSGYTLYGVGEAPKVAGSSDLNRDGKVNLIDFSILLFWWNSNGGASNPSADINGDGKVSLTDFSIMIFNWTG